MNEKKKFCFKYSYHNKKNKINPIPKGMSILNVIHNCYPTFQTNYLEIEKKNFSLSLKHKIVLSNNVFNYYRR